MKIQIHHIPSSGLDLDYEKPADYFASLRELIAVGECDFEGPISIQLRVSVEKDFVKVRGRLKATLKLPCARCLEVFDTAVDSRFVLNYSKKIPIDVHKADTDGIELTAEQIGVLFFKADEIDFTEAVQEQIVLAIPYRPLCSQTCKGLCAGCGKDLNQGPCQCRTEALQGPFAVLKDLKL